MKVPNLNILLLVGALVCAPAFTACQDEPEPVTEKTPPDTGSSSDEDPKLPDDLGKSWFDQPEEDRWPMRWMLGDDPTLRGPGEYEFQVPADGDELTIWFPDCNQFLRWVDFDGVVQLNYYYYSPVSDSVWEGVNYEIVDDNCVKLSVDPNGYSFPRKYAFSFHNRTGGGIVRFIFHQDAGDGHLDGQVDEKPLLWMSDDEPLTAYYIEQSPEFDNYFEIYPECHAKEFAIKCRNVDNLLIESLEYAKEPVNIIDSGLVECHGSVFEIRNDSLICNLCRNDGNGLKIYNLHILSDDGRSTRISIKQRYDETSFDKGRIYPYDPVWTVQEDGTRWTGGTSNGGVFRLPAEGDTITIESTGLYTLALVDEVLIDGQEYKRAPLEFFSGTYYDHDSYEALGDAITHRHKKWNTIVFGFAPNYTGHERVISLKIRYDAFPAKSVVQDAVLTFEDLFYPKTFLTGYDRFIFVQPPMGKSGNSCDVI